ncbi:hypothetical protein FNH13_01980 [Ornithinimicrobium ciconiae]|uniref:Uncharacterized protein n=1 Tax=Ornithinimicrobium ciconiae TaxID=2594265 RepID=A0A516G7A5_9MICO|nr:hypothetical protein [Ornithinimicrobium ciconiae]QDO87250.1 hypothetical protein FNH13_01980 [Ornithinimicrobium ciconiae]
MTDSADRRFAWAVFGVVVALLVAAIMASTLGARVSGSGGETLEQVGPEVVVVGAPGLSWTDITEQSTPTLWSLVGEGASAGLIVRGAHELTCPSDGWLTLGAGQRAAANDDGVQDCAAVPEVVPGDASTPAQVGDVTATIPAWDGWVEAAERRPLDAELGTLGAALEADGRCVRAGGPLAALGAAGPQGQVGQFTQDELTAYAPGVCNVTLLDAGVIADQTDAGILDARLAVLLERLPDDATLVVAGLADRDDRAGVRAVTVWRDEMDSGVLHSATTRQGGLVQTTDLTATVLALAGVEPPDAVSGLPVSVQPDDRTPAERVGAGQDLAGAIDGAKALAIPVLGVGCLLALALLTVLTLTGRRAGVRILGLAAMAFPSSAFLAGLVPWWRGPAPWLTLSLALLVLMAAHVALAMAGGWRRHPVGPAAVVAASTVVVIGADVILGGRLGLTSILGVQPITAGRFYGMGNVGYGIFAVSGLLLAGLLAGLLRSGTEAPGGSPHPARAGSRLGPNHLSGVLVVGVLGVLLVLIDGSPSWGADFGGVPALVVALGLLGLAAADIRLTPVRAVLIAAGALVVAAVLMYADWLRPADTRTHLGNFAQSVIDGGALDIVLRKLDQSLGILVRYPVSWVAVVILVVIISAVLAPTSWPGRQLEPLWRIPLLRSTVLAVLTCLVIGWALNDSGIAVVGIGLAVLIAAAIAIAAGNWAGTHRAETRSG